MEKKSILTKLPFSCICVFTFIIDVK